MNETRMVFYLFLALEKLALGEYKQAFVSIKKHAIREKNKVKNQILSKFGKKKGKIARASLWIIKTGGINVQQRGFLRWKFNVFPIVRPKSLLYINADRYAILRSIITIPKYFYRQALIKFFNKWKSLKLYLQIQKKKDSHKRFFLYSAFSVFHKNFSASLHVWRSYCTKMRVLSLKMKYINRIFLKKLQKPFETLKFYGYYYEDYVIETVVKKDKVTKHFKIMHKPTTQIEYYDLKTYDPAFRAVCRNLGHFIKRHKVFFFRIWRVFTETHKKSLESLQGFIQDSKSLEKFKLNSDQLRKLKRLLIEFCVIQEKICQMPENCIARWSEKAHIRALKEIKFKILTIRSQRLDQKKKLFFTFWKQVVEYSNSATDII